MAETPPSSSAISLQSTNPNNMDPPATKPGTVSTSNTSSNNSMILQNPSNSSTNPLIPSSSNLSQSPQISSPPLPSLSNISLPQSQQQLNPNVGLDYPLKPQQQQSSQLVQQSQNVNLLSNYQLQQSLQRSPSMNRLNQIQQHQQSQQQQFGVMRQQAGLYGQMNFGGSAASHQQNQQQQQQNNQQQQMGSAGTMSRSALLGQSGQLPILSGTAGAQFNLQPQLMASV